MKRILKVSQLMEEDSGDIVAGIQSIKWERIITNIKGYAYLKSRKPLSKKSLVLRDLAANEEFSIELNLDNDIFDIDVNIFVLSSGYPLESGRWEVFIQIIDVDGQMHESIITSATSDNKDVNYSKFFPYGEKRYIVNPYFENGYNNFCIDVVNYIPQKKKKKYTRKAIKRRLRKSLYRMLYNCIKSLFGVRENYVLFASDTRDHLSGNMEFVYNRMQELGMDDYKYNFVFKKTSNVYRKFSDKFKLPYYLALSKYIFLDDYYPMINKLKLRPEQEIIQLWHAVGAFKTFGYSRAGKIGGPNPFAPNHRVYTKAIVSSKHIAKYYAEAFGIKEENVYATGIPRTDIFFDDNYKNEITDKIYTKYPQFDGKKIITFAPTFRGSGPKTGHYDYDKIDFEQLYIYCKKNDYRVIFKMHPLVRDDLVIPEEYCDIFYDLSSYREINDLLFITDLLITDYSSTIFEASLLEIPMLLYAYDLEEYIATRDFYFKYEDFVPGIICRTFDELMDALNKQDYQYYKIREFRDKFFDHTDGKSTDRVIDLVFGQEGGK